MNRLSKISANGSIIKSIFYQFQRDQIFAIGLSVKLKINFKPKNSDSISILYWIYPIHIEDT